jgi:hypothetical protein
VGRHPNNYLFFSTKRCDYNYTKAIIRVRAWRIVADMCHNVGLSGNYGTHTLRKSWDYQARLSGVLLELIMHKLNHSSIAVT